MYIRYGRLVLNVQYVKRAPGQEIQKIRRKDAILSYWKILTYVLISYFESFQLSTFTSRSE